MNPEERGGTSVVARRKDRRRGASDVASITLGGIGLLFVAPLIHVIADFIQRRKLRDADLKEMGAKEREGIRKNFRRVPGVHLARREHHLNRGSYERTSST